jgi:hypothetical protein
LVETRLGSRVLLESTFAVALLAFRSHSVIAEVTPKEGSPASLPQTVLRSPLETAVKVLPAFEPGKSEEPTTSPATSPTFWYVVFEIRSESGLM